MDTLMQDSGTDYRHELKYYISIPRSMELVNRLMPFMSFDPHTDERGQYLISSVYFDTDDNQAYYASVDGLNMRKKYRIRAYNHSDSFISLEKKQKRGSLGRKTSVRITREIYDNILYDDGKLLLTLNDPLADEFYSQIITQGYKYKTIVEYTRRAFIYPVSDVRITLDTNIRGSATGYDIFYDAYATVPVVPPCYVVLEVKYDHFLSDHIRALLPPEASLQTAISKYAYGRTYQ